MQETTKRYQCRHIFTDGHRCGSPCLRHEEFCYYHHTTRRPVENPGDRRRRQAHFDIPLPEDRSAIQCSIGEVLLRIARNEIDPKRAGLLLYGLQIASLNLPPVPKKPTPDTYPVEEIVIDPTLGTLAPRIEVGKAQVPEERLSVVARLLRQVDEEEAQRNASRLADADKAPGTPRPASGTWASTASPEQSRIADAQRPAPEHAAQAPQEILPTLQACQEQNPALMPTYPKSTPNLPLPAFDTPQTVRPPVVLKSTAKAKWQERRGYCNQALRLAPAGDDEGRYVERVPAAELEPQLVLSRLPQRDVQHGVGSNESSIGRGRSSDRWIGPGQRERRLLDKDAGLLPERRALRCGSGSSPVCRRSGSRCSV